MTDVLYIGTNGAYNEIYFMNGSTCKKKRLSIMSEAGAWKNGGISDHVISDPASCFAALNVTMGTSVGGF